MTDEERNAKRKADWQRYYAEHREALNARAREHYWTKRRGKPRNKRDPEKVRAYNRAYAAANKDRIAAASRAHWRARRAAVLAMPNRFCNSCRTEKASDEFYPTYKTQCKACLKAKAAPTQHLKRQYVKAWQKANPDKVKDWRCSHRDHLNQHMREWYARKPEMDQRRKQRVKAYRQRNPHIFRACSARREAAQIRAMPTWADKHAIADVYREAARVTRDTGMRHEVDHIVPLRSALVCGLHVAYNLRVITRTENMKKGNRLTPHLVELPPQRPSEAA